MATLRCACSCADCVRSRLSHLCVCPPSQALLHAVSSGKGFRMSIVLCNHKPVVEGYDYFDREVWVAEEVGGEEYQEWV